jgi:hypothetical protein
MSLCGLAEQHNLPRIVSVQNAYCLVNRVLENGLDETMHRLDVSLLAYSPLAFGLLTGKYDDLGFSATARPNKAVSQSTRAYASNAGPAPNALACSQRYNQLGPRQRHDPNTNGVGVLLHPVAGGQHHHWCDLGARNSMKTWMPGARCFDA